MSDYEDAHESPKKGPTLSTSTSSFEALDPHDPNLSQLATKMFKKTEDYLYGEFTLTQDHYKRLEEMNKLAHSKYSKYHKIAADLSKKIIACDALYLSLLPHLQRIDDMERCVLQLEKVVRGLEIYSKRLEARIRQIYNK